MISWRFLSALLEKSIVHLLSMSETFAGNTTRARSFSRHPAIKINKTWSLIFKIYHLSSGKWLESKPIHKEQGLHGYSEDCKPRAAEAAETRAVRASEHQPGQSLLSERELPEQG